MYAERNRRGFNPAAAGGALIVNAGLVAMLASLGVAPQVIKFIDPMPVIELTPDPPPPPPPEPKPAPSDPKTAPMPRAHPPVAPKPLVKTNLSPIDLTTTRTPPVDPPPIPLGSGGGAALDPVPVDPPKPVLTAIEVDPHYRGNFQPEYPAAEQVMQREGVVVVRVLVGADGRVKQVEQVSATSPAFFDATRRKALSSWRFRPATRDGVPYPDWKQLTLRFVLQGR